MLIAVLVINADFILFFLVYLHFKFSLEDLFANAFLLRTV